MSNPDGVAWLRAQVEADLAAARALRSDAWGDHPWAVTGCEDLMSGQDDGCPCIVYQGEYKPFDEPQVPPVQYVADAESPEFAAHIARYDPRAAVADCEAKLRLLNFHDVAAIALAAYEAAPMSRRQASEAHGKAEVLALAVDMVAGGYRHRPGYAEHWGSS